MDWIKIKTSHILHEYDDLTDSQYVAWVKLMALTAFLERLPTREQMIGVTTIRTLVTLEAKLKKHSRTLEEILMKVFEDVNHVAEKRAKWRMKYGKNKKLSGELPRELPREHSGELSGKEGEGEGEGEGDIAAFNTPDRYRDKHIILQDCNRLFGVIATPESVKAYLKKLPTAMWWVVDNFLKKRFPATEPPTSYQIAEKELLHELQA